MYNNNIWELAEAWTDGSMNAADRQLLEERKMTDPVFAAEFQDCVNVLQSLQGSGEHKRFRAALNNAHKQAAQQPHGFMPKTISLVRNHWRTAAIAASIAMLTSLTTFWIAQHNNKKIASQYSLLRRDLETYKRSQNKIITDIKQQATPAPQLEARYTGTGFALTNDGYLVTSYHVISGADSVYIQNRNGDYYKTHIVAFNEATDVVVLKVEDKKFKFGKQEIPYT
ncbi:MAG: S1C family serine protease, partial [Taibaiella sp.]|nr:S1C family serine protease [Taibaiella sp.]